MQWSGSFHGVGNYLFGTAFPTTCTDTSGKEVNKYVISADVFEHGKSMTTLVCNSEITFRPLDVMLSNVGSILQAAREE